jgi:hypothetical protein
MIESEPETRVHCQPQAVLSLLYHSYVLRPLRSLLELGVKRLREARSPLGAVRVSQPVEVVGYDWHLAAPLG